MALLLLALISAPGLAQDLPPGVIALDARPAPPLEVSDLDGNAKRFTPGNGQWTFVHFWASWCAPCRREMPAIQRMAEQIDAAPIRLLLVNTAEDEDTVFTFLAGVAPDLESFMDRDGQATEAWRPRGLPATYLVDPDGRIRYQALGGRPWDTEPYLRFLRGLAAAGSGAHSSQE